MNLGSRFSILAICMLAIGLLTATARADVTYTFSGVNDSFGGDGASVGFQYTTASFVNSFTSLVKSELNSCTNCLNSPYPDVYMAPGTILGDGLAFNDVNAVTSVFIFASGAFGATGTYYSGGLFSSGKLVVSTLAVPEPGSLLLILLSGAFMGLLIWRNRQKLGNAELQYI